MRRGGMLGGPKIGGACDWSVTRRADVVMLGRPMNGSTSPKATCANGMETDVGWPTSTVVIGIVLQQSSP